MLQLHLTGRPESFFNGQNERYFLFSLSSRPSCTNTDSNKRLRLQKRCCKTENGRVGNDREWRFNWCLQGLLMALSVRDPHWQQSTDRRKETSSGFILSIKRTAGGRGWTPGEPWGEMRYGRKNGEEISCRQRATFPTCDGRTWRTPECQCFLMCV